MNDTILIIAGSDSCAGAGMQIDLKTTAAHGVHATCALTAVTAQNTREVTAIQLVDPDMVVAQIRAVFADMKPQAIKIGMLGSSEIAQAVASELALHQDVPIVLDPVLVATAGGALTDAAAFDDIRDTLIAQATVITPNIPEAEALSGVSITNAASIGRAAQVFLNNGAKSVLIKGGHGDDEVIADRLYTMTGMRKFKSERLDGEYHGTGCSLATAIACNLAKGLLLEDAVAAAHAYLADTLHYVVEQGSGSRVFNPLNRIAQFY